VSAFVFWALFVFVVLFVVVFAAATKGRRGWAQRAVRARRQLLTMMSLQQAVRCSVVVSVIGVEFLIGRWALSVVMTAQRGWTAGSQEAMRLLCLLERPWKGLAVPFRVLSVFVSLL
jgi:hypothetical protein